MLDHLDSAIDSLFKASQNLSYIEQKTADTHPDYHLAVAGIRESIDKIAATIDYLRDVI
jgi:hypothetical protein